MKCEFRSVHRVCGTCEHWAGNRSLHITKMFCEAETSTKGNCSEKRMLVETRDTCSKYSKWGNLK